MTKFAYFEDQFVPIEQAKVSITCNTLHYGTGCFGGLRAYWNTDKEQLFLVNPHAHYKRFLNSAKMLLCKLDYGIDQLTEITLELLRKEAWKENVYIRPIVYKDDGVFRVWLHDSTDKLAIFSQPVGAYIDSDNAISVGVSSWRRVDDNAIPARGKINGTYVNSALAKSEAIMNGFDEAIVLNADGHVSEASAANLMIIRDGVLITAPVHQNILEGITRQTIIQLAREDLGLRVEERSIDRTELYLADEAFFCGTGVQVVGLGTVDHRKLGDGKLGPITRQIRQQYMALVHGEVEKYLPYLSPVY